MIRPTIGITFDSEEPGGYSNYPWYALRENYCSAVASADGLPVALPHEVDLVEVYLDKIDGLLITGGAFDVDPAMFGEKHIHESVVTKDRRTSFEAGLCRAMLADNKPILGICGGQQLLHVVLGGTLHQHVPDEAPSDIEHEQPNPRHEASHDVDIVSGTLLHGIVGTERLSVNSAHHQAARDVPENVVVNARATDGLIEGIEYTPSRFCLGVQWHPEFYISNGDRLVFQAFVEAARQPK